MAYFGIERPKLGLKLSYEFEEERRTGPNIDSEDVTHAFREGIELETDGWVYNPALLMYKVGFEPEWEQRMEKHTSLGRESRNFFIPSYLGDLTFLQYKPYTLNLFARRYTSPLRSAFTEKTETETETYGANLMLKHRVLPTTLSYTHFDSEETGFFESEEDRDDFRLSVRHPRKNSDTRLNATYSDNIRTTEVVKTAEEITTRVKTSYNDIRNHYDLAGDGRKVLSSLASYRWTESNSIKTSDFGVSENFRWKHEKNLSSDYWIGYNKSRSEDFERGTTSFGAGLRHLLYENLTTSLKGHGSLSDFTGGSEDIYGGSLNFDYRRRIPWGMLNLNMGHDYKVTERDVAEQFIQVIDESHILRTGDVTLLENENVDINSIIVSDTTGTIVYVEDVDYTITVIDSFVRISRTTFGSIADGQEVLVDYIYLSKPGYDDFTFGQSYGINLDLWSALGLYYRYSHIRQSFLSGTRPDELIDDTIHAAGIRLDWRWSSTGLSYENARRSFDISTERWLAKETLTFRPMKRLFSRLSGRYGRTRFKESGEQEEFYGVRGQVDWVPRSWAKFRVEGFWDSVSGDIEETVDAGISSTLELSYRIWSAKLTYTFVDENDKLNDDRRTNHYVLFQIRRRLW